MANRQWIGATGGAWTLESDWAGGVPTLADSVSVVGPAAGGNQVIIGSGAAGAASFLGGTTLQGRFGLGTVTVGASGVAAALTIAGTATASSATVADGAVLVSGTGAGLAVSGTLTLGVARSVSDSGFTGNALTVAGGGAVQLGGLALLGSALVADTVAVDATSTLEVGSVGGAAAGALTVDAGRSVAGAGTIGVASLVNQGTVTAQGGVLRLNGAISGSGVLQVGAGGTLDLSGATADAAAVAFSAAGGTLVIGSAPGGRALNQSGAVSGFVAGDTIAYAGPAAVTGVSWQQGTGGTGVLTLLSGATGLGSLTLAGSYAASSFQLTPGAVAGRTDITVAAGAAAPAGTASRDLYAWAVPGSGNWGDAGSWLDLSAGGAAVAPGANDVVTLAGYGSGAYQVVTGSGNAASLTLVGATSLKGVFRAGALSVGTAAAAGALLVGAGSVVAAGSATVVDGPVLVSGAGAVLRVASGLTLGAAPSPYDYGFVSNGLTVSAGGAVQADALVLQGGALVTDTVTVDAASSLEVGEAGAATAGTLTIDAGRMVSGVGTIKAAAGIVNQGTVLAQGGVLRIGATMAGSGIVQVGAGGTLDLSASGSINTEAVVFTALNATLLVASAPSLGAGALTQRGPVSGFLPGDTIAYYGTGLTDAVWTAGSLQLLNGDAVVGTLALSGDYSGYSFQVTPGASARLFNIGLVQSAATSPSAGSGTDSYRWAGGVDGQWSTAANWINTSTGAAATVAPGVRNAVSLAATVPLTGSGNSSGLVLTGPTTLGGSFTTGLLTVAAGQGTVVIGSGGSVTAASAQVSGGALQASGNGARAVVSGTVTVGDASTAGAASLLATGGGLVQAGGLVLNGSAVAVDATSVLEVGSVGNGGSGRLTVDALSVLSGSGTVQAWGGVVDRGSILAQGTLAIGSAVTGPGSMQIALGSTLALTGSVASTAAVAFQSVVGKGGNCGTLSVASAGPGALNEQGIISGFVLGDSIRYAGSLTGAAWTPAGDGTGTLTLLNAAGVVGTLTLAGSYDGYSFEVSQDANGTSTIGLAITDPLFDTAYYLAMNPDVKAAGVDPYWHYMNVGWKEGRNPDAYFDTHYYLTQNPDVAAAVDLPMSQGGGLNPLTHFEFNGFAEGRNPSLLFSDSAYLAAAPDVKAAGMNPLVHFLDIGRSEGRTTGLPGFDGSLGAADPLVSAAYYDAQLGATLIPAGQAGQAQAAELYHAAGWKAGLNPDAWFDTNYYLSHNPDIAAAHIDPLLHYETQGWLEGRDPSAAFSTNKYLAANPDVAAAHMDPLLHFVIIGQAEGRAAFAA